MKPNNNTITISVTSEIMYIYYYVLHKCWPQCFYSHWLMRGKQLWKLLPENCYLYKTQKWIKLSFLTPNATTFRLLFLKREQNISFSVSSQNTILVTEKSASPGECQCANLRQSDKLLMLNTALKVALNSFHHIPRLRFWCVIITTLNQLMLQSQQGCQ